VWEFLGIVTITLVQMQLGRGITADSDQPVRMLVLRDQVTSQVNLHFSHRAKISRLLSVDRLPVFESRQGDLMLV